MPKVQRSDKQTDERMIRQSNIELLRIIAIIIIIAHHFAVHSGFDFSADTVSLNRLWIRFIRIGGKIGVNIFVLISGYFLVSAQSIKTSKILKLWGQVFFYSIVIFLVFSVSGLQPFSQQELIEHIAPVTYSRWWFASTYFVLYMLSPYINRLLRTFDRKQYISFLLLLIVLWSVIPTITGSLLQSDPLFWFVFLYSLAGYIKLFGIKTDLSGKKLLLISFGCTVLTFITAVILDTAGNKSDYSASLAAFIYDMQSLPVLIISLLMFMGFLKLDIGYNRIINTVSSAAFGVYLLHDDKYIRSFVWKRVLSNADFSESFLLIPFSVLVIASVYICFTLIELIRIRFIESKYLLISDKAAAFIDKKKDAFISRLSDRLK